MTNYEKLVSMSIDDLSKWFDEHDFGDEEPWYSYFNERFCKHCKPIEHCDGSGQIHKFYPCEFSGYDGTGEKLESPCGLLANIDIIKMWLEDEVE